ncbi:MAG TPA: hypothetical protein VFG88_01850, partial [Nocardioidaceae bacterium]|nr:hypothetical protein [Nocardioidaceae bacterium]
MTEELTEARAVDVPALTRLLDGKYAEVRELVRSSLAEHADILVEAEELDRPAYRQRVLELLQLMAETG